MILTTNLIIIILRSFESRIVPVSFSKQRLKSVFLQKIISSTDLERRTNKLNVLYQFMLKRSRINAGGRLLPFLIYCYNYFSNKLSFVLTKEDAQNQEMMQFLDDYLSKHLSNFKEDVMNQFKRMTCMIYYTVITGRVILIISLSLLAYYRTYSQVTSAKPLPSLLIDLVSYAENDGALYKTIFAIVSMLVFIQH